MLNQSALAQSNACSTILSISERQIEDFFDQGSISLKSCWVSGSARANDNRKIKSRNASHGRGYFKDRSPCLRAPSEPPSA